MSLSFSHWEPASCLPDLCFCENLHEHGLAQPANTLSSLIITALGLLILFQASRSKGSTNPMAKPSLFSALYAGAVMLAGIGSAFYHATFTFAGQTMDVQAMYLIALFILLYNLLRASLISAKAMVAAYALSNVALFGLLLTVPDFRRQAFAIPVVIALGIEFWSRGRKKGAADARYLYAAIGTLAAGYAIWTADLHGVMCMPESWVQGHAMWHVLAGVAAYLMWKYYASEEIEKKKR